VERSGSLSNNKGSHHEYRRYHDVLLQFLKAKRKIVESIDVEKLRAKEVVQAAESEAGAESYYEDAMDMDTTMDGYRAVADSTLVPEETRAEMEFLRALNGICWDRVNPQDRNMQDTARKEGNFWSLLSLLRELGLSSLIWANDVNSER
jgi:hypothetical protein